MTVFGLSDEQKKLPTTSEVNFLYLPDKEGNKVLVYRGDKVDLSDTFDKDLILRCLGLGPYKISWLALWRCGMGYVSLENEKGETLGMNASDLKFVEKKKED